MKLVIDNCIIDSPIIEILEDLYKANPKYLNIIRDDGDNIAIACPFHKDGQERKPSAYVYTREDDEEVPYGYFKCFACGHKGSLWVLVSKVLNIDYDSAKRWLVDNYSSTYIEGSLNLPEIKLPDKSYHPKEIRIIDESVLDNYKQKHSYMYQRKLVDDIIDLFEVGFNEKTNSITFPVRDEFGNLIGITERSVNSKFFHIPVGMDKPPYLLYYLLKEHIKEAYVCESQINALTLWSWGYPAIALFGTGSKNQLEILKKCGIRNYHLCFDGDEAGFKGAKKFMNYMPDHITIDVVGIPYKKDVNDLTKEEFERLNRFDRSCYG